MPTLIEPTQQPWVLYPPGSATKKQGGRLSRTVCSRAAESQFGFRGVRGEVSWDFAATGGAATVAVCDCLLGKADDVQFRFGVCAVPWCIFART